MSVVYERGAIVSGFGICGRETLCFSGAPSNSPKANVARGGVPSNPAPILKISSGELTVCGRITSAIQKASHSQNGCGAYRGAVPRAMS